MVLAVLFRVSSVAYAMPCQSVLEVLPLLELRPALEGPAWLAGTFAYRGALVSVIDACRLLGGYPCSERLSTRMAIVRSSTQGQGVVIAGVIAERMTEVRRLAGRALASSLGPPQPYLGSVMDEGSELVQMVDVDGLAAVLCAARPGAGSLAQ